MQEHNQKKLSKISIFLEYASFFSERAKGKEKSFHAWLISQETKIFREDTEAKNYGDAYQV